MRFSILAVTTLASVESFAPRPLPTISSTQLEMNSNTKWFAPIAVSIASLTLAGQIASATMPSTFAKYYEGKFVKERSFSAACSSSVETNPLTTHFVCEYVSRLAIYSGCADHRYRCN